MTSLRSLTCAIALAASGLAAAAAPSVLTVLRVAKFDSLDPPRQFDFYSDQVLRQVYSTLLTYSYLERPYKLEPDLLEAMPTLGADKVTLTFRLRRGVRFVDNACFPGGKGRELTADDVLYSLKRYADANVNRKSFFAMQGAVVGLDAFRAATAKAGPGVDVSTMDVAGLRKVDKYTFTIRLTHENPLFLYALTLSPTDIVPVEAVRLYKDRLSVMPVGTGPFMATGPLDRQGVVRLVRNPGYYRTYPRVGAAGDAEKGLLKDAGAKLPLVDVLELPLIEEPQPAALKFLRGELDRRELDRANFTKLVARASDGSLRPADGYAGRFTLASEPGGNAIYINVNMRDAILGRNKVLRQAIAAALDPQADVDVLWSGRGIAMHTIVPVELAGSVRDTGMPMHERDVVLAKKLLAQAGYPDGQGLPVLTMRFPGGDTATRNEFDLFKSQLAAVGIRLAAEFDDTPTFTKALDAGNFQLASYSYYADYPDAEDFYQMLYSRNTAPGPNYGAFADPAYDQAYEASRYMVDGAPRHALFRTMDAIIRDEVPLIPVRESLRVDTVQPWIANYKRNVFTTEMQFLRVDMAAKRKGP